jgi:hypothetical protein
VLEYSHVHIGQADLTTAARYQAVVQSAVTRTGDERDAPKTEAAQNAT